MIPSKVKSRPLHQPDPDLNGGAAVIFGDHHQVILTRTDRFFASLMVLQWIAGVIFALSVSPKTWAGAVSQTHIHVYAAVFLGGLITGFPVVLALLWPGRVLTR